LDFGKIKADNFLEGKAVRWFKNVKAVLRAVKKLVDENGN
jgi:hypothetical protein